MPDIVCVYVRVSMLFDATIAHAIDPGFHAHTVCVCACMPVAYALAFV